MIDRKLFLILTGFVLAMSVAVAADATPTESAGPSVVSIKQTGEQFELIRNGQPYFINGAGGSKHMDTLVEAGGNSIRTWSASLETLDAAHEKGLTVCMGLSVLLPRHGADYTDQALLKEQRDRIYREVMETKDHPALLMWGVGNEVDDYVSEEIRILVWKEIEKIAAMIKEIDTNHPVINVTAEGWSLAGLKQYCPSLDAVGINSYGTLGKMPAEIKRHGWEKPYLVTEFGPRGWWEAQQTAWKLPIEETSTEKAQFYKEAYEAAIGNKPNCLGSYVFYWANKQEKTHTWFNLFLEDGTPTEIIDTMSLLWTGQWPDNRAPRIGSKKIYVEGSDKRHIYKPSAKAVFKVQADDPDGDEVTVKWDLRKDESDNPKVGGDWERRIPPIEEAIVSSDADSVTVQMPAEPGNYRLFAYAYDPAGKVATANLPIRVVSEQ